MKPLLLVISVGLVLAFGTAAPANAAAPCWKALINDWFDGSIDHTYPQQCYRQAIQHLPTDVEVYSSAKDDIEAAMLAALRNEHEGPSSSDGSPSSVNAPGNGGSGGTEKPGKGVITRAIEWLGPSNAASVPLPLLILAGVAFLLLAAAGGSFLNRRFRGRRMPPPPQT